MAENWQREGSCASGEYVADLWFPIGTTGAAQWQANEAKMICAGCPVKSTCLEWALSTRQEAGIWGGLDEYERQAVQRRRSRARRGNAAAAAAAP